MRSPSIHITQKRLFLVLKESLDEETFSEKDIKKLARHILVRSRQHSLTARSLFVDKAKLVKSTSKVVMSSRDDASVFAHLLNLHRKQLHHRGISIIKVGSRDWLMIKEITKLANDFCEDFQLKRGMGYQAYIKLTLFRMGNKFNLNKFNSLHQTICDDHQANRDILHDITPQMTQIVQFQYEKRLGEKGIVRDYSKEPSKYIFFIKVKEECQKYGVTIAHYIQAQFEGLEWANAIPEPNQLIGDKAIDRLNRFLIKNHIKPTKGKENVTDLAEQIKKKWKNG